MCVCTLPLNVYSLTSNTFFYDLQEQRAKRWSSTHEIPLFPTSNTLKTIFKYLLIQSRGKKRREREKNERRERQDDWMRCIFLFLKELKMSGFLQRLSRRGILDEKIKKGIWKRMWVESRQTYTVSPSKQFFWLNIHTSVMFLHRNACFCHGEQVFCVCGEQRRETSRWHLQRGDACILALNWWRSRSGAAEGWKR